MKIRALGQELTFYDDDLNVIGHFPERPPANPKVKEKVLNILDYDDKLMGIDPNKRPDFFIDFNDEKFRVLFEKPEKYKRKKIYDIDTLLQTGYILTYMLGCMVIGYALAGYFAA